MKTINIETKIAIQDFLNHEVKLLDNRCYEEWLELLDSEIEYRMPVKVDRSPRHTKRFKNADQLFIFDDDIKSLQYRIKRIRSASCWTEDPPATVRHFITNVAVNKSEVEDEFFVESNFLVTSIRLAGEMHQFTGVRKDTLVRDSENYFKLKKRWIENDQTVISANDFTIIF